MAAALGCMSLWSCDNEQDLDDLSPAELEILELEELISAQPRIDEEALVADLLKGTMQISSIYYFWEVNMCTHSIFR